jgi:hypothetical protein
MKKTLAILAIALGTVTASPALANSFSIGIYGPNGGVVFTENGTQNVKNNHNTHRRKHYYNKHHRNYDRGYRSHHYNHHASLSPRQAWRAVRHAGFYHIDYVRETPRAYVFQARGRFGDPYRVRVNKFNGAIRAF